MKSFWIALKRKGSGKLLWIELKADGYKLASIKANECEARENETSKKKYHIYAGPLTA